MLMYINLPNVESGRLDDQAKIFQKNLLEKTIIFLKINSFLFIPTPCS